MSLELGRTWVAVQVSIVGFCAWLSVYLGRATSDVAQVDLILVAALILVLAVVGFVLKLVRRWSTRMLWEWIFLGAALLGTWVLPRVAWPGPEGAWIAAILLFAPLVWRVPWIQRGCFLLGAAGAGVFFATYVPSGPLWVLWLGLAIYDVLAPRTFDSLQVFLGTLRTSRRPLVWLSLSEDLQTRVLASHLVLPAALIAQGVRQSRAHGLFLLGALLIGSWYAMMRPREKRAILIVPWAAVWMVGVEVLLRLVSK